MLSPRTATALKQKLKEKITSCDELASRDNNELPEKMIYGRKKRERKERGQRSNRNFLACFSESRVMTAVERKKANDLHVNVEKVVKREKSGSFDAAAAAAAATATIDQN